MTATLLFNNTIQVGIFGFVSEELRSMNMLGCDGVILVDADI